MPECFLLSPLPLGVAMVDCEEEPAALEAVLVDKVSTLDLLDSLSLHFWAFTFWVRQNCCFHPAQKVAIRCSATSALRPSMSARTLSQP